MRISKKRNVLYLLRFSERVFLWEKLYTAKAFLLKKLYTAFAVSVARQ
jgi:hypothetical protein